MANEPTQSLLTPEQMAFVIKLEGIFMPQARRQRDEFYKTPSGAMAESARFVHYTSAKAALNIINRKRIWMRNALCMSDYREVQHGFDILNNFFSDKSKTDEFVNALDACLPGAATEAIALFNQWWSDTRLHTYIASISEHDANEDQHGRLSMWRAFGDNTARVALILKIPWNSGVTQALNLMFSPVAYLTDVQAHEVIHEVIANIKADCTFLHSVDREVIVTFVFNMLVVWVTCLKHEGFKEEREWRAIYSPRRLSSPLMKVSTEVINGVPQLIYNIPIDENVDPALASLDFSRLFDRLIIGPSQYPGPMYEAFTAALVGAGVPKEIADQRVFVSGIPIRT